MPAPTERTTKNLSPYRVFHDVVCGDFNIDHVLIGCSGIYTIETKTVSKYVKGIQKIQYDGETVSINGFVPDRNPINQAKAQAAWLKDLIKELTGRNLQIQPVVLYRGGTSTAPKKLMYGC